MTGAAQPSVHRLAGGGLVDHSAPLSFTFDGRSYAGLAGDTLASALVANGVRLLGRSFKYHRPRGLLSAGTEEPNALVELRSGARREPNTRATVAELFDGLEAQSQNRWPTLQFDVGALGGIAAPFLAAGFYYKTFMWPAAFWERVYEPIIRRAAGLGRVSPAPDPDAYEKSHAFCDVLVVGSGPAGLLAALAAARAGARVILAEEDFRFGGRCLAERRVIGGSSGAQWVQGVIAELASMPGVRLMLRTTVAGTYDHGNFAAVERVSDHLPQPPPFQPRQRLWRIHCAQCVLAAGSIERPIVFGDNDLPGVMLAGAVRSYVNRYAALPGRRAVIFTDNDDGWRTAADLAAAGAEVVAIVDPRGAAGGAGAVGAAKGAPVVAGAVERALGRRQVDGVEVRTTAGDVRRFDCDLVAVSGGWMPTLHLTSHKGARPRWDDARGIFVPMQLPAGMHVAGAAGGEFTTAEALAAGIRAGCAAAQAAGFPPATLLAPETDSESSGGERLWRVPAARGKAFVDFQHDVTAGDLELAGREGYRSAELAKRYTTLGMATDQGKTSNVNGLAILAGLRGQKIGAVGTTTFRPPYAPVAMGAMAGHHRGRDFRPTRLSPAHAWATGQGAVMMETGAWLRAQYFPRRGDKDWFEPTCREIRAVRTAVGVCDVSTLGKIDVQGPDALGFLERLYANGLQTLAVGRARYGLMLREDGFLMDDGTVTRLGEIHYLVTTTTANAVAVYQHMQYCHQVLWPALDVQFCSVTDQWAQFSIAGPRSRELVARAVGEGGDVSGEAMPFMAATQLRLADGTRARIFRISFSGEMAYELAVPAREGERVVREIAALGEDLGLVPYGLEALNAMRIEKGHVAGGELTGQTTAYDLGLGRMLSTKKDYIGAVLARRAALLEPSRPRLVGLMPVDRSQALAAGAQFVPPGRRPAAADMQGHLTSVAYSPSLGHWIGLGLLAHGPERLGEKVLACDPLRGREFEVQVCSPVFVDPDGGRQRV